MNEIEILKRVSKILENKGFTKVFINPLLPELGWSFDLFADSKKESIAIEFRKNDKIPDIFIEKIKQIKKFSKKLTIYLMFERKPRSSILTLLETHGIGVMVFQNNQIYHLIPSKDFSKVRPPKKGKPKKKPKEMHQIWVFVSSKQYERDRKNILKERDIICRVVREFNRRWHIPVFAYLVEYDTKDDRKFKLKITKNMKKCHVFICALQDRYGKYIRYEVEKVFELFNDKNLILILKKDLRPDEVEEEQKKLIKIVEKHTAHIPYSSHKDFEDKINRYLMPMIGSLYKKNKSKPPFEA